MYLRGMVARFINLYFILWSPFFERSVKKIQKDISLISVVCALIKQMINLSKIIISDSNHIF